MKQPILNGQHIIMRAIHDDDIPHIQTYASSAEVARNTFVPHPYPPDGAIHFVSHIRQGWEEETAYVFAIVAKEHDQFVGVMGLHPQVKHHLAEVGYWIGHPHWGKGYATEALQLLIQFAFETVGLNRVQAKHFVENPASGRVMQKAGMHYEGLHRQALFHNNTFKDLKAYAILREDYNQ
jgi:ribosomal-protein-alanine N-acetyltransferase